MRMSERPHLSSRLLVVDDDNDLRLFLQDLLTEEGYQVDTAATLDEALALIHAHVYHLVVTDLLAHSATLPLRSALIILAHARPTPVAALTGWNITAAEVTRVGLARLIAKPFDLTDLLTTVASSVEPAFSAEQQRRADVFRHFCESFNADDLDAALAICANDLRIAPPDQPSNESSPPIIGREACRVYLEDERRVKPDSRLAEYLVFPHPDGLAVRYRKTWFSPESPAEPHSATGAFTVHFSGERISAIIIQSLDAAWSALPPETAHLPGAQDRQERQDRQD